MFVITDVKQWDKFLHLYHKGQADQNYQYDVKDIIDMVKIVKNATTISTNMALPRELLELVIEFLLSIHEKRVMMPPLVFLNLGNNTLSDTKKAALYSQMEHLMTMVMKDMERSYQFKNLFEFYTVTQPKDWWLLMQLVYVATRLYGMDDTVANQLTELDPSTKPNMQNSSMMDHLQSVMG